MRTRDITGSMEIDMLPPVPAGIVNEKEQVGDYMKGIITGTVENKKYQVIPKRTWLTKNEIFIQHPDKRTMAFCQDKENLEVSLLPFVLNEKNLPGISAQIYFHLLFAAEILSDMNINPHSVLLPFSLPDRRVTGCQFSFSFSGMDEDHCNLFARILPVFSMTDTQYTYRGKRSLRVSFLTDTGDLGQDDVFVPLILPDRRKKRGNNIRLSIASTDAFPEIPSLQRILKIFLLVADYQLKQRTGILNLLKIDSKQYIELLKKVNSGNSDAENQLITVFHNTFNHRICSLMGIDKLKNQLPEIPDREYYSSRSLGKYLLRNEKYVRGIKAVPLEQVVDKRIAGPILNYFSNSKNLRYQVVDMDWEISTVEIHGDRLMLPNSISDFTSGIDTEMYFTRKIIQALNCIDYNFDRDATAGVFRKIIRGDLAMEFDLKSSDIDENHEELIIILAALADYHELVCSSAEPFKVELGPGLLFEPDKYINHHSLSKLILSNHCKLFKSIFFKKNRHISLLKITAPPELISLLKSHGSKTLQGYDFKITAERGFMYLYERRLVPNASGLLSLQKINERYQKIEKPRLLTLDKKFLMHFFNLLLPFTIAGRQATLLF